LPLFGSSNCKGFNSRIAKALDSRHLGDDVNAKRLVLDSWCCHHWLLPRLRGRRIVFAAAEATLV
jgi:hypothetical protein